MPIKVKELPELKLKNHGRLRSMRHRPAWDDRFFVEGVTNLTPAHPYFKKYFDKPANQTPYTRFRDMDKEKSPRNNHHLSNS
jgi:hypothetical protein